jgi:predicted RNA-binding Zn ribbon-like protein
MTATKSGRQPQFDLIAGNVCLDFVNTLDDRYTPQPKELLANYSDLIDFGKDTELLKPSRAEHLIKRSVVEPTLAEKALHRARALRESIHDVFWAIVHQRAVPSGALAGINEEVRTAGAHLILISKKDGFDWRFDDPEALDSLLWPIARAAADLLASVQRSFVRTCSAENCQWIFLDTSKSHQRRWCDMKRCGNRAKVRSFYERQRIHQRETEA